MGSWGQMPQLSLRFLGGLSIGEGNSLVSDGLATKALALVCYLSVTGEPQTREALASLLWSDFPEPRARSNLRDTLHALRRTTLAPYIQASRQLVVFNSDLPHHLDTGAFQAGVQESTQTRPVDAVGLQTALDHYRGEFLAGFHLSRATLFEEWVTGRRQQLNLLATEALQRLADYHLDAGSYEAGIPAARQLLTLDTWREESHRTLMRLLFMNGQLSAAIQQYRTCRDILAAELGVLPAGETQTLYENILKRIDLAHPEDAQSVVSRELQLPAHNLPGQAIPFIGREAEQQKIDSFLNDPASWLITLLGVGGSGKTRLALAVGERQVGAIRRDGGYRFPDGVFFVPLEALESPGEIVPALCQALRFQPLDEGREGRSGKRQLLDYLRRKRLLLILDNFEQLLDGARILAEIHRSAPEVHLLVTSRQKLALQGERCYPLEGMAYPNARERAINARQLGADYAAAALFIAIAQRVQPAFQLLEEEVPALIRVCHLVDGLPLAVELAAGWTNLLSLADIASEIEHSLSFLESDLQDLPDRHRNMEAVFSASWHRLPSAEQALFAQLCGFRGGFTRAAAEQVAGASLRQLALLASRGLIQYDRQHDRYRIHRLLRQYGAARLARKPVVEHEVRERHCAFFSTALQQWNQLSKGAGQLQALELLTDESANIRAAWRFASELGHFEPLGKMVDGLCRYYLWRRRFHEGENACRLAEERLAQSLAVAETTLEAAEQKRLLARIMTWHSVFCDRTKANKLVEDALGLLADLEAAGSDVRRECAFAWRRTGDLINDEDRDEKRGHYQQSLERYQELGDSWGQANVLTDLGWVAAHEGDAAEARRLGEAALLLRQSISDLKGTADTLWLLGTLAIGEGHVEASSRLLGESLDIRERLGDRIIDIAAGPIDLGMSLTWIGRMAEADEVRVEALALYETLGMPERIAAAHVRLATSKLHIGELEAMRHHATLGLEMCGECNNPRLIGVAKWLLAILAIAAGDLSGADSLLQESAISLRTVAEATEIGWVFALWTEVARRLGQPARARDYCYDALRTASGPLGLITALMGLGTYRNLLLDQEQVERALELNALLDKYPLIRTSYSSRLLSPKHFARLRANLPPRIAAAAVARGRARDLGETTAEILAELEKEVQGSFHTHLSN